MFNRIQRMILDLNLAIKMIIIMMFMMMKSLFLLPFTIFRGKPQRRTMDRKTTSSDRPQLRTTYRKTTSSDNILLNRYRLRENSSKPDVVKVLQNKLIDNALLLDRSDKEVVEWDKSFINNTQNYHRDPYLGIRIIFLLFVKLMNSFATK